MKSPFRPRFHFSRPQFFIFMIIRFTAIAFTGFSGNGLIISITISLINQFLRFIIYYCFPALTFNSCWEIDYRSLCGCISMSLILSTSSSSFSWSLLILSLFKSISSFNNLAYGIPFIVGSPSLQRGGLEFGMCLFLFAKLIPWWCNAWCPLI